MKKCIIYFHLFLLSSISLLGQQDCSVPYSSHVEDQVFQGPCFVFAAVAAIEAQSSEDINLSEWYYWNTCVMTGIPADGGFVINKVVEHVNTIGALYQDDFYEVTEPCDEYFNLNDPGSLCFFDCINDDWCKETNNGCPMGLISEDEVDETCIYGDAFFMTGSPFTEFLEGDLTLQSIPLGEDSDKIQIIRDQLCINKGVIVFITDYTLGGDTSPVHSVFVHGVEGDKLVYKDSWPGNPSKNRKRLIDQASIDRIFVIDGTVSNTYCGDAPTCECELVGSDEINGQTTYTIVGQCDGTKIWEIPEGLDVVSGGTSKHNWVKVEPNSCIESIQTLMVVFEDCPPISKEITVLPEVPAAPTDILMLALELCPNSVVEFTVIDNNAYNPSNIYEWEISGAGTIASGQGTSSLFVKTKKIKFGFVTLTVRIINECGFSDSYSETFNFDQGCNGGGNEGDGEFKLRQNENQTGLIQFYPNPTNSFIQIADEIDSKKFEIFSQYGKSVMTGTTKYIDVSDLAVGVYFIRSYNNENQISLGKFLKVD